MATRIIRSRTLAATAAGQARLTFPTPSARVAETFTITGTSAASNIVHVVIDGVLQLDTTAAEDGTFSVVNPYPLTPGRHRLSVHNDVCGGTCSEYIYISDCGCAIAAPIIAVPTAGVQLRTHYPTISGTAQAYNTVRVCIAGAGCMETIAQADGAYEVSFATSLPDGAHTVTVEQISPAGLHSAMAVAEFHIVSSVLVAPTLLAPTHRAELTAPVIVTGMATPGNTVHVCLVGHTCKTEEADDAGAFAVVFAAVPPDTYVLTVQQTDADGNASPAESRAITVV